MDMDEHYLQYSSDLQLPSSSLNGNYTYDPYSAESTFSQQPLVKLEDYDNYSLPQWIGYQHLSPNYVDYLLGNEISMMKTEIPYESTGIGCSFTPNESLFSMDVVNQAEPYPYAILSRKEHDEMAVNDYIKSQYKTCYQATQKSSSLNYQLLNEDVQYQPNMSASASEFPTRSCKTNLKKTKASEVDRRRRKRISAALDALGNVLPQSKEGNRANIVDDCMDYIKYLQLQMKELSQNRLGGEPTSSHLIYLEGYGHYLVDENGAIIGPLQGMLVKLLNENPSGATRFLASQDLFMMPFGFYT